MEKIEKCEREMGKIDELWAGRKIYGELARMGLMGERYVNKPKYRMSVQGCHNYTSGG